LKRAAMEFVVFGILFLARCAAHSQRVLQRIQPSNRPTDCRGHLPYLHSGSRTNARAPWLSHTKFFLFDTWPTVFPITSDALKQLLLRSGSAAMMDSVGNIGR